MAGTMIQDIAPHTYDPVFRRKEPVDRDYLLYYEYNKVMLLKSERGSVIPTFGELKQEGDFSDRAQYLFSIDDRAYYCVTDMAVPAGWMRQTSHPHTAVSSLTVLEKMGS